MINSLVFEKYVCCVDVLEMTALPCRCSTCSMWGGTQDQSINPGRRSKASGTGFQMIFFRSLLGLLSCFGFTEHFEKAKEKRRTLLE